MLPHMLTSILVAYLYIPNVLVMIRGIHIWLKTTVLIRDLRIGEYVNIFVEGSDLESGGRVYLLLCTYTPAAIVSCDRIDQ